MEFLEKAIQFLPKAASSPYGLVAYAITIIAWLIIASKVQRNKQLLKNLNQLPEKDRLVALELEMGGVHLEKGISPEQWLKFQSRRYLITGYIFTLIIILFIFIIASSWKPSKAEVDLTLVPQPSVAIHNEEDSTHQQKNNESISNDSVKLSSQKLLTQDRRDSIYSFEKVSSSWPETKVNDWSEENDIHYTYSKKGDQFDVFPIFRYKEQIDKGEAVDGISYTWQPFSWEFPVLSYKVANNTSKILMISEIVIDVNKSAINTSPLLFVNDVTYYGKLHILNDGWGDVLEPSLKLAFFSAKRNYDVDYKKFDLSKSKTVNVQRFSEYSTINIIPYLDDIIKKSLLECNDEISSVCVGGVCTYTSELDKLKCTDTIYSKTCKNIVGNISNSLINSLLKDANEFSDNKKYTIKDIVYVRECRDIPVYVNGELSYLDNMDRKEKKFRFRTLVYLGQPGVGAPAPPSYSYDLFLEAGRSNYTIRLPVSQQIAPGETDHFIIRVGSNKSANFNLNMSVLDTKGNSIKKNKVNIEMILSKSGLDYANKRKRVLKRNKGLS